VLPAADALAADYLMRAGKRFRALEVLMAEESWPDVVREAQEIVGITLKGLLGACSIEMPRIHDVSPVLEQNRDRLPAGILATLEEITRISKALRRDRELAFYGSEDLTSSEFYNREDAATALASAQRTHQGVQHALREGNGEPPAPSDHLLGSPPSGTKWVDNSSADGI
jgi:HEPN domain-containing protein